jgi:hypothetical protein
MEQVLNLITARSTLGFCGPIALAGRMEETW